MIRPAVVADADDLSRVHRAGRRAAYAGWGRDEQLDAQFDPGWWWDVLESGATAFVGERDGAVAGLALLEDDRLDQLYVDPAVKGSGLGGRLFDAAVAAGARELWVYEPNVPARGFYEHRGWHLVPGSAKVDPTWSLPVPAVLYRAP